MTQVTDRPIDADPTPRRNRVWKVAILVPAIAVLVLTAALVANRVTSDGPELPDEAAEVIDAFRNAYVDQDISEFWAVVSEDFLARSYYYGAETHDLWEEWIEESGAERLAYNIEFKPKAELIDVGQVMATGDGPWFVSAHEIWEDVRGFRWDGMFTYVVVDESGTMKLAGASFVGTVTEVET